MVVKSATKKKLMDLGIEEEYAHKLADDRKWDDVKGLSPGQIAQICGIDSGTSSKNTRCNGKLCKIIQSLRCKLREDYCKASNSLSTSKNYSLPTIAGLRLRFKNEATNP